MRHSIVAPQVGALGHPDLLASVATAAETLGFDGIWVLDRLLAPLVPSEPYPASADGVLPAEFRRVLDPIATLSFLAARTTRVGLGTSVLATPLYSAAVLARQLATIDVLSSGRLQVGLGGGWSSDELRAVGAPTDHRGARNDEFIETMLRVWTADVVSYDGRFEQIPASRIDLKPVQRPHPPIHLAAYSPVTMRRVARYANGWNPAGVPIAVIPQMFESIRGMAAEFGRDPEEIRLIVRGNVVLTPSPLDHDRPSFVGSFAQVIDDVRRCEAIGADEVILDAQFTTVAESAERYLGFLEDLAVATVTVPA